MARVIIGPYVLIAALAAMAVFGSVVRTYALHANSGCVYRLAERDESPSNVLFIGTSRIGRGIDARYIEKRLVSEFGKIISVERISMFTPNAPQFRPVLKRYVDERGAPKLVFLQLLYNFKPERQREVDMPVNPSNNIAFASIAELADIQRNARLNDYDTVLPRWLEANYASLPVVIFTKLEMNIYAAMKFPGRWLSGRTTACRGESMFRHMSPGHLYDDIDDKVQFEPETAAQKDNRLANLEITADYLPFAPLSPKRQFENGQLQAMINFLESAGSEVVLIFLPALGETEIPAAVIDEIKTVFPNNRFEHPMSLYESEIGEKLAVSFLDTHHINRYGALLFSRYFTEVIARSNI